ncbi:MAG: DNA helicase II / ATP-dependent DNA helicase PcrA [Parcubacteria group bacterium Gr01-1014_8]|nr:MAG: DNA helicase II / ATP-dependent DNA helicase PcrA [Parcubacteria group bacterium Gr01-1014_8]
MEWGVNNPYISQGDNYFVKLSCRSCYSAPVKHLHGLNERQMEAALHTEGPLLIVAGAGAGKTKTITHRIAHLMSKGVSGASILAVTFTNKAAGEMRGRIRKLLSNSVHEMPYVATFHSLGVRLLREFANKAGISRQFVIWDRDDSTRALKKVLKDKSLDERYNPRAILSVISREKGEGRVAETYGESTRTPFEKAVAEAWTQYEKDAATEHALDFDDLLLRTLLLLQKDIDVLSELQQRWSYITIDEYQDTNRVQYELARLLGGARMNVCAVGDVDQNIYSWRGADIAHLLSFETTYPHTKTILLEKNYRSTQTILTAANAVIAKNTRRYAKNLYTDNPTGEAITLYGAPDERMEAQFVVRSARELMSSGVDASEIAVLYRENFQSRSLEEVCIELGIPYRVLGVRFFERTEVKDLLSYLRAALNPASRMDISRIIASPPRGIGKQTLEKLFSGNETLLQASARAKILVFRTLLSKIREKIETASASKAVHFAFIESGLEKHFKEGDEEDRERFNNARELVSLATKYDALPAPLGIEHLLEDAALMSEQDSLDPALSGGKTKQSAISLMTVHASKGLEFDAVFITGLEQGLFPSMHESDDRDPEEERRLFYVALTRARKHLFLSYAASRLKYGSREYTMPSEFLEDIDTRLFAPAPSPFVHRKRGLLDTWSEDAIT